jgi:hypothetical protein
MLSPAAYTELAELAQTLVDKLRTDIQTKPVTAYGALNASGNLAASVRFELTTNTLTFYAANYWPYADAGREPVRFPPISAIMQWIEDKGIQSTEIPLKSQAFLIARKIALTGTVAYQQGGTDLIADVFTPEDIAMINNIIQSNAIGLVNNAINQYFKPKKV